MHLYRLTIQSESKLQLCNSRNKDGCTNSWPWIIKYRHKKFLPATKIPYIILTIVTNSNDSNKNKMSVL